MKVYRIDCTGIPKCHNPIRKEEWDVYIKAFIPHRKYSRIWLIAKNKDEALKLAYKYFKEDFTKIKDLEIHQITKFKQGDAIIRIDGAGSNWAFVEYYNE